MSRGQDDHARLAWTPLAWKTVPLAYGRHDDRDALAGITYRPAYGRHRHSVVDCVGVDNRPLGPWA